MASRYVTRPDVELSRQTPRVSLSCLCCGGTFQSVNRATNRICIACSTSDDIAAFRSAPRTLTGLISGRPESLRHDVTSFSGGGHRIRARGRAA